MTAALGFAISRSEHLGEAILRIVLGRVPTLVDASVSLEVSRLGEGRTDIEIEIPGEALLIIEAKLGVDLPSNEQIQLYLPRLRVASNRGMVTALLIVTNASEAYAEAELERCHVPGVRLQHCSWADITRLVQATVASSRGRDRVIALEYLRYLQRGEELDRRYSNMVYVVALAEGTPPGWDLRWQDVVRERSRYFYPVGKGGWPDPPPNYIAFRYRGRLQSIHHVDDFEVFSRARDLFPEAADEVWAPHYCLTLGAVIAPSRIVKAGPSVRRAARVWCMLDALLTTETVTEAMKETRRRLGPVA